jgi:SAM-dependent methyltransferase
MAFTLPLASRHGVPYWRERAEALGARAVLNLDHEGSVDAVTAVHRALLLPQLAALLPLAPGSVRTVLDLGCGSGRLTGDLAALAGRAIGVDPVAGMIARAPLGAAVEYRRLGDPAGPLPLADGEVAVAFTCLVLGGIDGPVALAAMGTELERVLAPCGIVSSPSRSPTSPRPATGRFALSATMRRPCPGPACRRFPALMTRATASA